MRQYYNILLLSAMMIVFWGCAQDSTPNFLDESGQPVVILISAESRANTSTEHDGDPADQTISSLRVLVYESANGNLAFNIPIPTISDPIQLNIKTGRYDFVFIANEGSDNALTTQLAALTPDTDRLSGLYNMSFTASAFAANKDIPMVTHFDNVVIINNEQYQTPDMQTPQTGVWPVLMERLGIRLDITLLITQSQYDRFSMNKKIHFTNIPDRVYLAPVIANNGIVVPAGITIPSGDITITSIANPTDEYIWEVQCNRIILPENTFFNKTDASKALTLTLGFGTDDIAEGIICLDPGIDHTLPRNTYFDIDGKVLSTTFTFNTTIQDWTQVNLPHEL